jgi:hypothetical protein
LTEDVVVDLVQTTCMTHKHRLFSWRDGIEQIVIEIFTVEKNLPFLKTNR